MAHAVAGSGSAARPVPPAAPPRRDHVAIALSLLTALALALRLPQLDQSLFGDELFAFDEVAGRSFGGMLDAVLHGPEVTPPAYFVLAWLAVQLGDPTIWIRLPSLLAGVALVPVTYLLGTLVADRRTALLAAAVVALWPHALYYSVEARPYAMLALVVAATTVCLLRALRSRRRAWWAAYAALSLLAVATHLTAIFVLGAQALWAALAHREQLKPLLVANAAAAVAFAPWLTRLQRDDVGWLLNLYGGFDASVEELADEVGHVLVGYPVARLGEIPGTVVTAVFAAVLVAVLVAGAVTLRRGPVRLARPEVLLAALPLAVVAGLFANSALSDRDLVSARNLTSATPYVAVAIGALVTRLPRVAATAAGGALLACLAVGAAATLGDEGQRPRYREAAAYIERSLRPGDVVVERLLFPAFGEFGRPLTRHLDIYLDRGVRRFAADGDGQDEAAAAEARRSSGRILLLQPSPFETVAVPRSIGEFRLAGRHDLPALHPVAVAIYER